MRLSKCVTCGYKFSISPEDKDMWTFKKKPCPSCGEIYASLPLTERKLFILQDRYLDSKKEDRGALAEIADILLEYTKSLSLKYFTSYIESNEALCYYSDTAVSYFIEELTRREGYRVNDSFAGAIKFKIKQAILNKYEVELADESLDWSHDDSHGVDVEDPNRTIIDAIVDAENALHIVTYIYKLILGCNKYHSPRENYIRLLAIHKNLRSGERWADKLFKSQKTALNDKGREVIKQFQTYNKLGKYGYVKTMGIIQRELRMLMHISY